SAAAWAREHGLPVHVDGARLWNAAVATGRPEAELVAPADTVSVCFSKGLGAPVGSLLAFASTRREDALRLRRRMGGSLRQAGVLAAAALHALRDRPDLARDHARAAALASALREVGYAVPRAPETNMVVFEVDDAPAFVAAAEQAGLRLGALDGRRIRAVTHRDLGDADLARARDVLARLAPACGDASA
ncbi:MAG: beta-eliminating lyase-related protein, partial [Myxococcota bacterium]